MIAVRAAFVHGQPGMRPYTYTNSDALCIDDQPEPFGELGLGSSKTILIPVAELERWVRRERRALGELRTVDQMSSALKRRGRDGHVR
jgi:hypothetical protein